MIAARPIRDEEVHVWTVRLESTRAAATTMEAILSEAELKRASRFAFERDKARFISCRATLRELLGRYAGIEPERVEFHYGPQGKPEMVGTERWHFNVSHAGDFAAIAIARHAPVGIDIERIDPDFPRAEVAREVFTQGEVDALGKIPREAQAAWFFQLWTVKEALLKAGGAGFSLDPLALDIRFGAAMEPTLLSAPEVLSRAVVRPLPIHDGYRGALAVLGTVSAIASFSV